MTISENSGTEEGKKRCPYCSVGFADKASHVNSQRHVLNYLLYNFNKNRKALITNKKGVSVNLTSREEFARTRKKRTYTTSIDVGKSDVEVGLQVRNEGKTEAIITEAAQLLDYEPFTLSDEKNLSNEEPNSGPAIRLLPGAAYNFKLRFENPGIGVYRMPVHFGFTVAEEGKNKGFSIVREIEIRVQGEIRDEKIENEKSPYSGDSWKESIKRTVKGHQKNGKPITKIEQYSVPKELRELILKNLEYFPGMTDEQSRRLGEIKAKYRKPEPVEISENVEPDVSGSEHTAVRQDNYQSFFRDLLHIEEQEQKFKMSKYNMTGVTVKMIDSGKELRCLLEVPGLAEKRPSVLKQDVVYFRLQEDPTIQYSGLVQEVRNSFVVVGGFHENFALYLFQAEKKDEPKSLDVRFTFSRYPLFVQHRALDLAAIVKNDTLDVMSTLFPKAENCGKWPDLMPGNRLKNIKFFNRSIETNEEQKQAVFSILQGKSLPAPYILFGPPGTGKTVTLVESILQVRKNFSDSRILVCAQCNSACDYIAAKLKESGISGKDEIVRLNSSSRTEEVPKEIAIISRTCPQDRISQLEKYKIVVCTLISAGRFIESSYETIKKGDFRQRQTFTHVFIDEAGQASECESLVAISGLLKKPYSKVAQGLLVLAGDPKQLGPVCNGTKSKTFGLGVSLLERLITNASIYKRSKAGEYDSRFVTQLVKNFRSHGDILDISNKLFYKGNLVPQVVKDELCNFPIIEKSKTGFPVVFHGVFGEEKREGKSPSIFNMMEVSVVLHYIDKLLSNNKVPVKPGDIGIIAPYARQVYKLRREFKKRNYSDIEVGTTETFQGREKRVIIVTTVRSQTNMMDYDKKFRLGFLREPKRFNVIMTRAQSKLIIVGNPMILGQDPNWKIVIDKAAKQNSYTGCPIKYRDETWEGSLVGKLGTVKNEAERGKENRR